ncbi:hypothetical protein P8452_35350 [Trifolium repens]|nr:hypothetical protein P8452_35350 [Trifolium repens]
MVAQASVGDLSVGLYAWSRNLLPIVVGKSGNPQSRDFVLQLVEKILSTPEAQPVLVNGAVRKGEQLIPPPAFDTLIRVTFPSSNRVKIYVQPEFLHVHHYHHLNYKFIPICNIGTEFSSFER